MRGIFVRILVATAVLCLAAGALNAQTVFGTILGTVTDQSNALVAGAEVSARNLDIGTVRKVRTEANGTYRISSIPAGTYDAKAVACDGTTEATLQVVIKNQ